MKNIFKKKEITKEFLERNFGNPVDNVFPTYTISKLSSNCFNANKDDILIEDRQDVYCLCRGYNAISSYWLMDIKYVRDLKRVLKLYGIKIKLR